MNTINDNIITTGPREDTGMFKGIIGKLPEEEKNL